MNNTRYYIWLSLCLGYGNCKIKRIYDMGIYSDMSSFYNGGDFEWKFLGFFSDKEIDKMHSTPIDKADAIIKECEELGYQIISIDDDRYPQCLRDIDNPPAVIYVSGYLPRVDNLLTIGIVGTRNASSYGKKVAYSISYNLAKKKVTIISGGALGIDSCAHTGALNADAITLCVLGCGINYPYLVQNEPMRKAITARGCLISEYPPGTEPLPHHFVVRNRIISALSKGLLVVEAGKKSGALRTATFANEQGKAVFAVMGNINSIHSMGSNELIKDGAVPVTTYLDILKYFNEYNDLEVYEDDEYDIPDGKILKIPAKKSKEKEEKEFITGHRYDIELDEKSNLVYHTLGNTPMHIDEVAEKSGLPVFKVSSILTNLEMKNLIVSLKGRQYKIK
ncbi:MAG: DNA-processing protein DprA [Ruminococcus sp.]